MDLYKYKKIIDKKDFDINSIYHPYEDDPDHDNDNDHKTLLQYLLDIYILITGKDNITKTPDYLQYFFIILKKLLLNPKLNIDIYPNYIIGTI